MMQAGAPGRTESLNVHILRIPEGEKQNREGRKFQKGYQRITRIKDFQFFSMNVLKECQTRVSGWGHGTLKGIMLKFISS
jgi:hypothetical protein